MTGSNGAHVEVTVRIGDPLTVTNEACHPYGRYFASPLVRDMLRALGVRTCGDCHRVTGLAPGLLRRQR